MNYKNSTLLGWLAIVLTGLFISCDVRITQFDTDAEIERLMREYDLPSISACVIHDGQIVWRREYGYSDKELQIKADEETIYHVASISKLVIATAVMQLAEQNMIELDQDINVYLPVTLRNPHYADTPITPRMLLMHTGSVAWPQYADEAPGIWDTFAPDQAPAPSEWIPDFLIPFGANYHKNIWLDFRPGEFEHYTNIGCNILAYLVEQVSGLNFREYCKTRIFETLGMRSTSYNYSDLDLNHVAKLYRDDNTVQPPFDDRLYASGGLKTSLNDMSRFLSAYMNGGILEGIRILQEETVQRMLQINSETSGICLLWRASFGNWFGHTGGMDGAASIAEIHPESGTAYIIFCNQHNSIVYQGHEIFSLVRQKANEYID